MQKKVIALAVAALASSAAFAQTNVTVYGVADASFENIRATGATDLTTVAATNASQEANSRNRITSNSSYIGFKGVEDLGNGLKAVFQIETQLALDNANDASAGTRANSLANRDSYVAVAGNFGTVAMGYLSTPHRNLGAAWDVMPGATGVAGFNNLLGKINTGASLQANGTTANTTAGNTNTIFRSQALAYISPTIAGFNGVLAYVPNENKATNTNATPGAGVNTYEQNTSAWNLGLNYAYGPFKGGYSYLRQNDPIAAAGAGIFAANDGGKLTSHLVAGKVTFGDLTLGLAYNRNRIEVDTFGNAGGLNRVSSIKNSVWAAEAKYVLGKNEIAAMYQRASDGSVDAVNNAVNAQQNADDRGASAYALRYGYNMSKRTQAYALYSKISNDKNGNYDFGAGTGIGNQQAVSAGSNISAFGVGLRHSF